MSGLEALGGAAAVAQIVTQSLSLLRAIYGIVDRLRKQAQCLAMVADEVTKAIRLVSMIESVAALNIEPVLSGVQDVYNQAAALREFVQRLDRADQGNLIKRFTYQLIKRPTEQVELDNKVASLTRARDSLLGHIQVAHVGITVKNNNVNSAAGPGVVINIVIVDQVEQRVHDQPGLENGLLVANLLRELRRRGMVKEQEREVYVDKSYLAELETSVRDAKQPRDAKANAQTSFVARDFVAKINSVQVAGPIGDGTSNRDGFVKFDHMEITGLTADDGALQIAGPNSTNTLESLQDHQLRLAAVNHGQQLPPDFFYRKR